MMVNAVIVTYNRKKLVSRCVDAVLRQTVKIDNIFIVDNASSDGTQSYLEQKGYLTATPGSAPHVINKTTLHYIRLAENSGGAGGFYAGMQCAYNHGGDFFWIMDDDGFPHETCLEKQLELADRYQYIMPISLSPEKENFLTWFVRKKNRRLTRSYSALRSSFPEGIMHHAVPFNGLLLPRGTIDRVGYPKKEMFIWGDDFEYQYRCMQKGVEPVTLLDAIFFHPEDKATCYRVFFGLIPVIYTESKLHFTCLIRNSTYNYWNYRGKYIIGIKFFIYSWLFLVAKKGAFREYFHYLQCVKDGITGNFTRHLDFIK